MRYRDAEAWAKDYLAGLVDANNRPVYRPVPMISPGPSADLDEQKLSPNELVFFMVGGGGPWSVEGLFNSPLLSVRVAGAQNNYNSAEDLAWHIDTGLLSIPDNGLIGSAVVKPVVRSGGVPQLLNRDNGGRYHFICSYIVETQAEGAIA